MFQVESDYKYLCFLSKFENIKGVYTHFSHCMNCSFDLKDLIICHHKYIAFYLFTSFLVIGANIF